MFCGEQGKLPAAKAFKLAERDKQMSEQQKPNYMAALDQWIDANVISPLVYSGGDGEGQELTEETVEQVKKAIREKVLESYKNGLKAGAVRKEPRREYQR